MYFLQEPAHNDLRDKVAGNFPLGPTAVKRTGGGWWRGGGRCGWIDMDNRIVIKFSPGCYVAAFEGLRVLSTVGI